MPNVSCDPSARATNSASQELSAIVLCCLDTALRRFPWCIIAYPLTDRAPQDASTHKTRPSSSVLFWKLNQRWRLLFTYLSTLVMAFSWNLSGCACPEARTEVNRSKSNRVCVNHASLPNFVLKSAAWLGSSGSRSLPSILFSMDFEGMSVSLNSSQIPLR